jgi:ATP-dependent RNA helicase RhlE
MTAPTFAALRLHPQILRALQARGYETPTPIQARAIPLLLQGKDLLGIAQTGTGKTAAFGLPMLHLLSEKPRRAEPKRPRALVLAPTRELASQILEELRSFGQYLPLRSEVVYGGVGMTPQIKALQRGADIVIATPGRLLDHISQRTVDLGAVEILVLDEADRMLDMGFIRDVEKVLRCLPRERHSLLFSATMPDSVASLAKGLLKSPERVAVTPPAATTEKVEQSVCFVDQKQKQAVLTHLLQDPAFYRTLVFTRTKHGADRVAKRLVKSGIEAKAIHGDKSQGQRERALDEFRRGDTHVLVATDLAARGIDVPEITHVVNFDLPNIPDSYVHRIGRTARAGRDGMAISLCSADEREYLRDIEKLIRKRVPVVEISATGEMAAAAQPAPAPEPRARQPQGRRPQHGARQQPRPQPQRVDWTEIAREVGVEPDLSPQPSPSPRPHGDPTRRHQGPRRQQPRNSRPGSSGGPQSHGGRPSGQGRGQSRGKGRRGRR